MPIAQELEYLRGAELIVQVAVVRVDVPDGPMGELGECTVTGRVRRVFRGDCAKDTSLRIVVPVFSDDPPLGHGYQDLTRLRSAPFLEAYLERSRNEIDAYRALETALPDELGDAPEYLTALEREIASAQAGPGRSARRALRSFVDRLLGRR